MRRNRPSDEVKHGLNDRRAGDDFLELDKPPARAVLVNENVRRIDSPKAPPRAIEEFEGGDPRPRSNRAIPVEE